jgi:hypothetical protein
MATRPVNHVQLDTQTGSGDAARRVEDVRG